MSTFVSSVVERSLVLINFDLEKQSSAVSDVGGNVQTHLNIINTFVKAVVIPILQILYNLVDTYNVLLILSSFSSSLLLYLSKSGSSKWLKLITGF